MADIFVSYARADKARVVPLVAALEAQGWSVWWDPAITPGQEFDRQISAELDAAKAVIVVWTPQSVDSRWVRGEARDAADRGVLVPVRFENTRLPIDARAMHTTDLDDWRENPASAPFQELVRALARLVPPPSKSGRVAHPSDEDDTCSIAVLPFADLSPARDQDYFSDGLSEELLNQLAQLKGLRVISRTSSFAFKGKNEDARLIGQKLGVANILEGSVRKAGNRLRITAQLIKCDGGHHLWSNTYDRDLDDVFAIQEDVARAVASALKIALGVRESTLLPGGTSNTEAYDLFLRARANAGQSIPGLQRGIMLYREALDLDPGFAQAWMGLGSAYVGTALFSVDNTAVDENMARAEQTLASARACAPDLWQSHLMEGWLAVIRRDWLAAQSAFDKTREQAPPGQVQLQAFLQRLGRTTEAIEAGLAAMRDDPLSSRSGLVHMLDCAGRFDEAEALTKRERTLPVDHTLTEYFGVLRAMAREGSQTVKPQLKRYLALVDPATAYLPVLNDLLEKFDDRGAALALVRQAATEPANQGSARMSGLALFSAYFGDDELALDCLRRAFIGTRAFQLEVLWNPLLARMRKTAGFKQLVRDLGIAEYWKKSGHWGDFARPLGDDDFEIIR